MTTTRYWFNEFKRGRTSVLVTKIHDIMLADLRVKIREIADIVDISTECIQNILNEKLGMRKLSARWMGTAFAHSGTKTESHDNFGALFGHV